MKEDEYPISNIEQNSPLERGVREANGVCKTSNEQLKMCVVDGCNKEVFCRGLCENHYKRWQLGKIEHPTFGKFFKIHHFPGRKPKKKPAPGVPVKDKIQKSAVGTDRIEEILPTPADELSPVEPEHTVSYLPPKGITLDLDSYPKIKEAVYGSAEKHFLTPEHVIISLLGKALADRKEKTSYIK
ncbi:MAG: hypothetical protein PF495_11240 [Spirochaetales bacterium]|nr:hypothetical protein [Spirochaetales bacterium]